VTPDIGNPRPTYNVYFISNTQRVVIVCNKNTNNASQIHLIHVLHTQLPMGAGSTSSTNGQEQLRDPPYQGGNFGLALTGNRLRASGTPTLTHVQTTGLVIGGRFAW